MIDITKHIPKCIWWCVYCGIDDCIENDCVYREKNGMCTVEKDSGKCHAIRFIREVV